ncbi:unnamed protein product [Blepharisma stoltei]|uniref:Uncharacterized protein n=1 Tax=Blepharisma stoltei TaxID=1481888 RepID=A0AAU9J0J5_9CILI|nr:unnamed protein product [Blepharisma stoltei]
MGGSLSLNYDCYGAFWRLVYKGKKILGKEQSERMSILEEDEICQAGLLSECEIQRLLNESQDYGSNNYLKV